MALNLTYPPGATPLDPDELAGLIPTTVTTVEALNAYEAENILDALAWLEGQRSLAVLDDNFVRDLHRRMFNRTWQWSGQYRTSLKNIGVTPDRVSTDVRNLVLDCAQQIQTHAMPLDEIAARFHHRLVWIHPFANGNGRHARLMTDLLLEQQGAEPFSWGSADLIHAGPMKARYIDALRRADNHDTSPLFEFVRS